LFYTTIDYNMSDTYIHAICLSFFFYASLHRKKRSFLCYASYGNGSMYVFLFESMQACTL